MCCSPRSRSMRLRRSPRRPPPTSLIRASLSCARHTPPMARRWCSTVLARRFAPHGRTVDRRSVWHGRAGTPDDTPRVPVQRLNGRRGAHARTAIARDARRRRFPINRPSRRLVSRIPPAAASPHTPPAATTAGIFPRRRRSPRRRRAVCRQQQRAPPPTRGRRSPPAPRSFTKRTHLLSGRSSRKRRRFRSFPGGSAGCAAADVLVPRLDKGDPR